MADSQSYGTPLSASRMAMMTPPVPSTPVSSSYAILPARASLQTLPPYRRVQILLQEMAGLTVRILEISGAKFWQHKGALPSFLASATVPPEAMACTNVKDILAIVESHQSQLTDAVAEISEMQLAEEEKQRIAGAVAAKDVAIRDFAKRVRCAEQVLESTLEEFEEYRRPPKGTSDGVDIGLGKVDIAELISYAHKISYTTFAPPDYTMGQPGALAPAPQEQQMRASQLYNFSDMDLGLMKPAVPVAVPSPAVEGGRTTPALALVPPVGLPPGIKLPPMPAGWKPGDPVPLPEQQTISAPQVQGAQQAQQQAGASGVIQVPFVQLDLNPELEDDYATEYSEEEESSGEEE